MKYLILTLFLISTAFGQVPTGPDTICHLKLYDGYNWTSGGVLYSFDYSLNGNYGTLKGTAHYTYPGVDLDGDSDYIEIADADDFSPVSTSLSISAWIYMDAIGVAGFPILSKYATDKREWIFSVGSDSKLRFTLFDESAGAYIGRLYNTTLSTGKWLHVVGTFDWLGGVIKLYLNGVRVDNADSENGAFNNVQNLTAPVWIGRETTAYSNGKIDDVIITKSVLSATEVRSIYELTRARYQK